MTIVNFHVTPTRCLVAVDTLGGTRRRHRHCNKLFPIAQKNILVTGRGSLALVARVASIVETMPGGLDECKENLPQLLPGFLKSLVNWSNFFRYLGFSREAYQFGQEIYIFGWSELAGEMVALQFYKAGPGVDWAIDDEMIEAAAPGIHGQEVPDLSNANAMKILARLQVQQIAKDIPGYPSGGALVLAELTKTTLRVESLGTI